MTSAPSSSCCFLPGGRTQTTSKYLLYIFCVVNSFSFGYGQTQSFREVPSDTSVIQGQSAILNCRVNFMKGQLLWTKEGFSIGYGRDLHGFPRYSIIGTESLGENDLMITLAELEDDGTYQCQILPAEGEEGIRSSANLNILIPPVTLEISGSTNGSVVKVPHQQESLVLECISNHGKPAPELQWYRNGEVFDQPDITVEYSTENLPDKRQNAKSILTMKPSKEDNGAFYKCEATHPALHRSMNTVVQLSVMHPPSEPEITGYTTGQVVQTNHTLKLMCIARGGNPLAQVYWYKNGKGLDFSYDFGGNKAENDLTFLVEPTDNEAVYRCEASNLVTLEPLVSEVKLIVQFPPRIVTITGQEHAKAGETITLKCETSISNPPAAISWLSRGRIITGIAGATVPSPKGGYVTTSEIEVTLTSSDDQVVYQCNANNEALGFVATDTISLKVVYPPGQPSITGYTEGREVTAEQIQTMTCQSMGGNPPATLTWWKGENQLQAVTTRNFNLVSSQVSFILKPDDNGAEYRCNATNPATVDPLLAKVTLKVNFPPKSLSISVSPRKGRVGQRLTLTCRSASSNPASTVYWVKDGDTLHSSIDGGKVDASYGGWSSVSILELIPTVSDHNEIYACNAKNDLIERAVSDAVTLNILFKPVFPEDAPGQFDIIEFNPGSLNLTAFGNPGNLRYAWYHGNHKIIMGARKKRDLNIPYFEQDDGVLIIKNISREDRGRYIIEAGNSQGKTNHSIVLNVQYPAEIVRISQNVLADKDSEARLECVVDANPLDASHINWTRDGYNMSYTNTEFDTSGARSVLILPKVSKEDSGLFVCTAYNDIGGAFEVSAQLIVKYAPEIDKSPTYGKAAADKGATARLTCKAEGAPDVTFVWFRIVQDADVLLDVTGTKLSIETKKPGLVQYESYLLVHNTTKEDYGQYKCVAKNSLGEDNHCISLDGTSKPDPPFDLQIVNATHNSITLSWQKGFNGGTSQRFQVRYVEIGQTEGHKYVDVTPLSANVFTVTGLKTATEYNMDIRAINRLGQSGYQEHPIKAKTSAMYLLHQEGDEVPLIIILVVSIIGMILLGLNVLLILFFIRRRKKKLGKGDNSSTTNTVEMYNAPTLTEDSKSMTTYDRRSFEEYQDDFYKPLDEDAELRKFLGPAAYGPPDALPPYSSHYPLGARNEYSPPPALGNPRLGPEPIYGSSPVMYPAEAVYRPRRHPDDEDDYTYQLRKMQQSLNGADPRPSGSMGQLPLPADIYGTRTTLPPPPYQGSRSGLDGTTYSHPPQVPTRNYEPDDLALRYTAPPEGPTYEMISSTDGLIPAPTDVRGHLV